MNRYSEMNDGNLVELTLLGDSSAYEELVCRHEKSVLGTAYKVTGNLYSAEDASQDAFVCAWINLNRLNNPARFSSWVCTIAKNHARDLVAHYRSMAPDISLDLATLADPDSDTNSEIDRMLAQMSEGEQIRDEALHDAIGKLSEGIRRVIILHYFEELSVAEIAESLQIPEGTVKWRLSEGRKKIRKEYGVMENTYNENEDLVRRVMYQVEKLKLWQLRTDKSGFEEEYRAVLDLAEKLDDGEEKSHAMADILLRGYWWIPGAKNDEMLEKIKLAAEAGKNDDVMQAWAEAKLGSIWSDSAQIACINDELIPYFTDKALPKSLGYVRCMLAKLYCDKGLCGEAEDALNAAFTTLTEKDEYYHTAKSMLDIISRYKDDISKSDTTFIANPSCYTLRSMDGVLYQWQSGILSIYRGNDNMRSVFSQIIGGGTDSIVLDPNLAVGGEVSSADGTSVLRFKEDGVTVVTPAGTFENCAVFEENRNITSWWYKKECTFCPGVGIVRCRFTDKGGVDDTELLSSYSVHGDGLLPLEPGNRWSYDDPDLTEKDGIIRERENTLEVTYTDGDMVYITNIAATLKKGYTDTWLGNIVSARLDYWTEDEKGERTLDVSDRYSRAIELAETPRQLTHAKVAADVAKRIYDTDMGRQDDTVEERPLNGLWNFFTLNRLRREGTAIRDVNDRTYGFEWKCHGTGGRNGNFILNNFLLEIIGFAIGDDTLWSDEWVSGYHFEGKRTNWEDKEVHWTIDVTDAGTVETAAGKFEGCLCVAIWSDLGGGFSYMAGNKEYYYAPGVGIVKYVTHFSEDDHPDEALPYELTEYRGTGEGYFPIADGLFRHFDAIGIGEGCTASVELTYSVEDGDCVIFCDQLGVQERDWKAPEEAQPEE